MQRTIFERKLSTIKAEERDGRNAWPGWRRFIPYKVVSEGSNMKSFYLKPLDGGPLATYAPGQFLTIKLPTGDVRSWSISDWPQDPGAPEYYRITIKRAQTASVWMIDKSTEDTVLEVRSPKGGFVLDQKTLYPPRQVYLSAGVGITPLIAMLKAHKSHVSLRHTPAIWIHVCRNGDDLPCKDDLEKLPSALKRVWCFTTPLAHETFKKHYDIRGRPNMQLLENLISGKYEMSIRPGGKSMQIDGSMSVFYICGPTTFKEATKVSLTRLGISDSLIRSEQFASDGIPEIPDLEHAVVRFTKSKVEAEWTKDQPCTILELAERAGLKPDSGCRVGMCGSCSSRLICGTVAGGLQLDGSVYICQARPSVPEVEIEM
jgi:ferredoxin-NADP reductase